MLRTKPRATDMPGKTLLLSYTAPTAPGLAVPPMVTS